MTVEHSALYMLLRDFTDRAIILRKSGTAYHEFICTSVTERDYFGAFDGIMREHFYMSRMQHFGEVAVSAVGIELDDGSHANVLEANTLVPLHEWAAPAGTVPVAVSLAQIANGDIATDDVGRQIATLFQ